MPAACGCNMGLMVFFGTGRFFNESDRVDRSGQSFYGILDSGKNDCKLGFITQRSTGQLSSGRRLIRQAVTEQITHEGRTFRKLSNYSVDYGLACSEKANEGHYPSVMGWFLDFPVPPDPLAVAGERVTGRVVVRDGKVIFCSHAPVDESCSDGAQSWVYMLNGCFGGVSLDENENDHKGLPFKCDFRINDNFDIIEGDKPGVHFFITNDARGNIFKQLLSGMRGKQLFWWHNASK